MKPLFLIINICAILIFSKTSSFPIDEDDADDGNGIESIDVSSNGTFTSKLAKCNDDLVFSPDEFVISTNGTAHILTTNQTLEKFQYMNIDGKLCIVDNENPAIAERYSQSLDCETWYYNSNEFKILENGSVLLLEYDSSESDSDPLRGIILEEGTYVIEDNRLETCADDYDYTDDSSDSTLQKALILIGQLGTGISIVSLSLYLVIYTLVPTMRNLPGYNLTSLSVAFLMAYCFVLFGQIPSVLGVSCVMSASLEHFFFLAGFLWMNVIAIDVWRALTLAIHKLVAPTGKVGQLRFLCYSLYAWGIPLCLAIAVVSFDYSDGISDKFKPLFGHNDICWFNNETAKIAFFVGPVFLVLVVNTIFFAMSAFMIITNEFHRTTNKAMKEPNEMQIAAKRNFILYSRLGLIMGVPWLMVIIGVLVEKQELWMVFDTINSLQGLFIFLLFSCSKKTLRHIRNGSSRFISRDSSKSLTLKNSTTNTSRSESQYSRK